jgi:hypothetical protein
MRWIVKVERFDGELGAVFPDDLIERHNLKEGDTFRVVVDPHGFVLAREDPSLSEDESEE